MARTAAPDERADGKYRSAALKRQLQELSQQVGRYTGEDAESGAIEFGGDAYEFLVSVFKDPRVPLDVRMQAASTVIKYERPALQAVAVGNANGGNGVTVVFLPTDADL